MKNSEGYSDPTAITAERKVDQEINKRRKEAGQVIRVMQIIASYCGFRITRWVELEDKRTKIIYK